MLDWRRPSLLAGIVCCLVIPVQAWAQACVVHTQGEHVDVKVCQENLSIPEQLFSEGFCQPKLKAQQTDVTYVERCPGGAFGVCSGAHVDNMPYRQNIHYYGVASDGRYLKPFCELHSQGHWQVPIP